MRKRIKSTVWIRCFSIEITNHISTFLLSWFLRPLLVFMSEVLNRKCK